MARTPLCGEESVVETEALKNHPSFRHLWDDGTAEAKTIQRQCKHGRAVSYRHHRWLMDTWRPIASGCESVSKTAIDINPMKPCGDSLTLDVADPTNVNSGQGSNHAQASIGFRVRLPAAK